MKRIQSLNRYQKMLLLIMAGMVLGFTVLYFFLTSREGFAYRNSILFPGQAEDATVYSGKIEGERASFTVYADKTVWFQYRDQTYGPYTIREDASAIPQNHELAEEMTGIELLRGEDILFRGGVLKLGNIFSLYCEDGTPEVLSVLVSLSDGTKINEYGSIVDRMEPSASDLLQLVTGPVLTHKGEWGVWFCAVFICIVTALSILFADELFRWQLMFQIRNPSEAEPSEWEISSRYISWTILPVLALGHFISGTQ